MFFSWLVAPVNTEYDIKQEWGLWATWCLHDFKGMTSYFLHLGWCWLIVSHYIAFILLSYGTSCPTVSGTIIRKTYCILEKALSESIENISWFLTLIPCMCLVKSVDCDFKTSLHLCDKKTWYQWIIFDVYLFSLCKSPYCIILISVQRLL